MSRWGIQDGRLVLDGADTEIPTQYAAVISNPLAGQEGFCIIHYVGQTVFRKDARPSLVAAIRLAEEWVR